MAKSKTFLAFDMGAESGRAVAGTLDGGKLTLDVIHRFPNVPVQMIDGLHWDLPGQYNELKRGLGLFVKKYGCGPAAIGCDTWGVDFGLVGAGGSVMGLPFIYRDSRTDGMVEEVFAAMPKQRVYEITGTQTMQINTVFQLAALNRAAPAELRAADKVLMMAWMFTYLFSGAKVGEFSLASTSQCFDMTTRCWSTEIFDTLGLPVEVMPEVVDCGTEVGRLLPAIAEETGAGDVPIMAVGGHDTADAVAAVPARGGDWAFLSSGTWSLLGVEMPEAVLTEAAMKANFTNEGCIDGKIRFLTNIAGLWLVQQCRKAWAAEGTEHSYAELTQMAADARPFASMIDPDDPEFLNPADMPEAIRAHCRRIGTPVPEDKGQMVRTILEALALRYRRTVEEAREVTGRTIETLHIVGGGTQNTLLNRLAAGAVGVPVVTGPVEATAAGNILTQAMALGELGSVEDIREVVRNSFDVETYEPTDAQPWEDAYGRYRELLG